LSHSIWSSSLNPITHLLHTVQQQQPTKDNEMYAVVTTFSEAESSRASFVTIAGDAYTPALNKGGIAETAEDAAIAGTMHALEFFAKNNRNRKPIVVVLDKRFHAAAGKAARSLVREKDLHIEWAASPEEVKDVEFRAVWRGWVVLG
jgi:hypothetical protein